MRSSGRSFASDRKLVLHSNAYGDTVAIDLDTAGAEFSAFPRSVVGSELARPLERSEDPHPHGQIWATETVPNDPAREHASFAAHRAQNGRCPLCEYVALESRLDERVVCENQAFAVVVPFWAAWPFEALLVSRRHLGSIDELDDEERDALADIVRRVTIRYDNLFDAPFPYSMGFHQRPVLAHAGGLWHFHGHFYPPLLRSASIRKFMVGFELLGSPQRDLTPEDAAARLRGLSEVHDTLRTLQVPGGPQAVLDEGRPAPAPAT